MSDLTHILDRIQEGDANAANQLLPLIYEELRRLAAARMAQEAPGQTLQPTALVHEAWLRLAGGEERRWQGRACTRNWGAHAPRVFGPAPPPVGSNATRTTTQHAVAS